MAVLRISLIVVLCSMIHFTPLYSQETDNLWVRLGTLWDAPGNIVDISPDSRYVTVTQDKTTRLVRIETGEVIAEVNKGRFQFSPSGRYAAESEFGIPQSRIYDLQTATTLVVDGYVKQFLNNEQFVFTYQPLETIPGDVNRLVNLNTGESVGEYLGAIVFTPDTRLATATNLEDRNHVTTQIIEIATGAVLAEFVYDYAASDGTWSLIPRFHANGRYLSIYYFPEEFQVIDTTTWKILYRLPGRPGGFGFSFDGHYIVTVDEESYGDVQLMDASSGRILDTVFGSFGFSGNSRYLFRNEAITYDLSHLKIIELNTNNTVFEYEGMIFSPVLVTDSLLQLYDRETESTRYFDITTGNLVQQVEGRAELHHNLLVVDDLTPLRTLQTWESSAIITHSQQIEVTPNGKYALTSNGLLVDVYGLASTRYATMPPPRPTEGIARMEAGEIDLYPSPNALEPRIIAENNLYNPTYMYVLGQAEQGDWLYVTFVALGHTIETVSGWVEQEKTSEIQSWAQAPALNTDHPLEALRAISYLQEQ